MARKIRIGAWHLRHTRNWPAVIACRILGSPLRQLALRDGTVLQLSHRPQLDLQIFTEVYCEGVYSRWLDRVPPDGLIVDVGANVGIFTIFAAKHFVPEGRVVAVEPNPRCVELLSANLRGNGLDSTSVVAAAIAGKTGCLNLLLDAQGAGNSSLFSVPQAAGSVPVAGLAAPEFLRRFERVDLMKVDCEGGEHPLIWETEPEHWSGVQRVVFEYHLGLGTGYSSDDDLPGFIARLKSLGFAQVTAMPASPRLGYVAAEHA